MRFRLPAKTALSALLLGSITRPIAAETRLRAAEAKDHIGQEATVCDVVASTRYVAGGRGQPTFLNLDKPYPNQMFTVVIWGSDRPKFGKPEEDYQGKNICVRGKITSYREVPEIVASPPGQITVTVK